MEYLPCFYAFGCCMAFCVALHVRGAAMFWTSLGGALGWFVYVLCAPLQNDILQYFFGTLALAVYAEVMARVRRSPATGYLHVALLPMVPGTYAYKTVFSMIMFFQDINSTTQGSQYLQSMIFNGAVSFSVLFMLAVGATLPVFLLREKANSMTRGSKFL